MDPVSVVVRSNDSSPVRPCPSCRALPADSEVDLGHSSLPTLNRSGSFAQSVSREPSPADASAELCDHWRLLNVDHGGKNFKIVGIVHSPSKRWTFRAELQAIAREFPDHQILCEDKISAFLGRRERARAFEMQDQTVSFKPRDLREVPGALIYGLCSPSLLLSGVLSGLFLVPWADRFLSALTETSRQLPVEMGSLLGSRPGASAFGLCGVLVAYRAIGWVGRKLGKLKSLGESKEFSQPDQQEKSRVQGLFASGNSVERSPRWEDLPLCLRRSIYMSAFAESFAKHTERNVILVVGEGHALQIAYYLKRLDQYRDSLTSQAAVLAQRIADSGEPLLPFKEIATLVRNLPIVAGATVGLLPWVGLGSLLRGLLF